MTLIDVRSLSLELTDDRRDGRQRLLSGIDLTVAAGECLGVAGRSGAGKSVLARTLVGLEPDAARVTADRFRVCDTDMIGATPSRWRRLRGRDVGLVLQDALQSLDPLRSIHQEVGESLIAGPRSVRKTAPTHDRAARRAVVTDALRAAGLPDPQSLLPLRSEQLSGGMRQRVLIASAIVAGARVIVADEPTTALDQATARRVLDLFAQLRDRGCAIVLISHDLRHLARVANRVVVLDHGQVAEVGETTTVLHHPVSAEAQKLIAAIPRGAKVSAAPACSPLSESAARDTDRDDMALSARSLTRTYRTRSGIVTALDGVDLDVPRGRTLGIVGESGSGKSTLARLLLGAETPDDGSLLRDGDLARARLIPQDPLGSFDPRYSVERILRLAARTSRAAGSPRAGTDVAALLRDVRLDPDLATRHPATLSGGQRQRVAIARALAADPDLLICDEAVSALDVTTQADVLALLLRLQREHGKTMVFISHDLAVVRQMSDTVAVMQQGRVVDSGPTEQVWAHPRSDYTRLLIAAAKDSPIGDDGH